MTAIRSLLPSHRAFARAAAAVLASLCLAASGAADFDTRYLHERWTAEDGMPVRGTTKLIQSRDGYLWLATYDGLVRFDGARFTVFNTSNSGGLPSNRILELFESGDGALWLRTEQDHIVRFAAGEFHVLGEADGLPLEKITLLHADGAGTVWMASASGVYRYEGGAFVPFGEGVIEGRVSFVARDARGAVCVSTSNNGLYRIDGEQVEHITQDDGLPSNRVDLLLPTADGNLWVADTSYVAHIVSGRVQRFDEAARDLRVYVIGLAYSEEREELWMGTPYGLLRLASGEIVQVGHEIAVRQENLWIDEQGAAWSAVGHDIYRNAERVATLRESAPQIDFVSTLLVDREGSIWLATANDGLHRLKPAVFSVRGEDAGIEVPNIYPIVEGREGRMWLGSWGSGAYELRDGIARKTTQGIYVSSLLLDSQERLWLGGVNALMFRDPGGDWQTWEHRPNATHVLAIYEDDASNIWFGTNTGLYQWDGETLELVRHGVEGDAGHIRVFCEGSDGSLWMGSKGAGVFRHRDGEYQRYTVNDGLPSDLIRSVCQDAEGVLWVGTEGSGLSRMILRGDAVEQISNYRKSDGLFDETIHQILEDDYGRLWMSTNQGIFWVHRDELTAFAEGTLPRIRSTSYAERDGMLSREANGGMQPAGIKASDGRLWFPTQAGAVVVDPAGIRTNEIPPPVVVESVRSDHSSYSSSSPEAIQLDPRERNFEVDYTALSFLAPENVRFRYRLEGFDPDWIEAGQRRTAFYTNVPPGDYEFRVIASNNDGVWNEAGATLPIRVIPRLYETSAFMIAMGAAVALLALTLYRLRLRRLEKQERELRELVAERTRDLAETVELVQVQAKKLEELDAAKSRFFANISHEFRTPLTLTIGPLENLVLEQQDELPEDAAEEIELALRNSRRLLRLVNQILDVSKLEAGQMQLRARRDDLNALLGDLADAFRPLAESRDVEFRAELPSNAVDVFYDSDLMEKIASNLLSNAFKFTPEGGTVLLTLEDGDPVRFSVRDTGPGIPHAQLPHIFERFYQVDESARQQAGTGIGLSLAKELAELHGGHIEVETKEGFGCTFRVSVPAGSEHLHPSQIVEGASEERVLSEVPLETAAENAEEPSRDGEDVPTVLVADDSADIRAYVRRQLQPEFRVLEAADGQAALQLAREEIPDLLVSDVMMPELDGFELCRAVKADPSLEFIPVILLTAKATQESKVDGLGLGADDYVTKPFDIRELLARIHNLIASRQKLKEQLREPVGVHAAPIDVESSDEQLLRRIQQIVEAQMGDEEFSVEELAQRAGLSRGHLHRRLRAALDETPTALIRRLRLERAAQLLAGKAGSVSEIAYAVGFKSVSHFSRSFRTQFGVPASEYSPRDAREIGG